MTVSPLSPLPRGISDVSPLNAAGGTSRRRSRISRLRRQIFVGHASDGISRDALIRLVDHPELPLRIHTRDTIKAGRTALLVRGEFPIGNRIISVAYKRVERRSGWKSLSAWLFGNRTLRTWKMALTLERLGIPTASPLMVVIPRWHHPFRPSYLASEWLNQAMNLTAYSQWLEAISPDQSRQRLQSAAEKLGELIGRMHSQRISHRDLKAGNLLLRNNPSSVEAYVIDLDGARRHIWLTALRRFRDLSRLVLAMESQQSITHATRLRFLLSYLRVLGESTHSWKPSWRRLAKLAERRRLKKQARALSR